MNIIASVVLVAAALIGTPARAVDPASPLPPLTAPAVPSAMVPARRPPSAGGPALPQARASSRAGSPSLTHAAAGSASAGPARPALGATAGPTPPRPVDQAPFAAEPVTGLRPLGPRYGVRLGEALALLGAGAGARLHGGSAYAQFDAEGFFADLTAELYVGKATHLAAAGMGAYVPLASADLAPYVGGGLKLGYTRFSNESACSLIPFAGVGVVLGRAGQVTARAELGWFQVLTASGGRGDAGGPLFSFGLGR